MCVGIGLAPVNEVVATDCNNNGIPDETEWGSNSPHVYVNWAATGANTGQTWDNAHTDLQTGLCTARRLAPFYARVEIHVAAGVYRPAGAANPEIAFEFRDDDYRVNGGYSRNAAGQWVRDIDGTPTILDGDLLGNDGPDFANFDDNSHCVILVLGEDASLELDGLHIRGGNAPYGGAGISTEGRLSLTQCRLYENRAQTSGGAVFAYHAHVTASRTLFRGNQASIGTAICAPGIGFSNCVISGNPPFSLIPGSDAIFHKPQAEWGVQLYFCTIVGNAGGATNLSSTYDTSIFWRNGDTPPAAPDPLFVDEDGPDGVLGTSDDNYRLTAESPYVNAAIDLGWSVDYAGQPREQQCQADAGAFESPYAPDCDGDGQGDHCQIDANRSLDTNRNRRLDRCEPCIFTDCNANGLLDAFEPDSDGDGLIDACDDFPRDPSRWFKPPLRMQPCPTDLVLSAQSDRGAVVAIAPPAADGGLGAVRVTSDAPADGLFPIGDTLVTVTARDEADAVVTCSFRITVRPLAN